MAKRHPGQRRLTQTKAAEEDDDIFIAKVLEFWTWATTNRQFLTVVGAVVVIAGAAFLYYRSYRRGLVAEAGTQLEQIHQSIALNDTAGAKNQLKVFVDRFGGTPYAGEARMLLGEIYLENGSAQQAQAVLEPMASAPSTPLELQAAGLLARSYEQEGRWKDAEDLYLRLADRARLDFEIRGALADAARIRASHGDAAGAAELYHRILDGLDKNAPDRGLYEMRLAELTTDTSAQGLKGQAPAPKPSGNGG
jgi:predicted negative regulator of RcsB-dependent stress response